MKSKIGFISTNKYLSKFNSFKGYFVNPDSLNFPGNPDSPNYPRKKDRVSGLQNPLLGDPGYGEIARWQKVKTSALATLVDQMIEQFTRDRDWYSKVRCRESLWNMYRRLEWWVSQNVEPGDSDYQNALSFIRDCIAQILDTGERPRVIYQHNFKDGLDSSFSYDGDWRIDEYGYLTGRYFDRNLDPDNLDNYEPDIWSISRTVDYSSDGLVIFSYAVAGFVGKFLLKVDGEIIWEHDSSELVDHSGYSFRDITLNIPKGQHDFTWEFVGEIESTTVNIEEIVFVELFPEIEKSSEIPKCPQPYTHHFSSDYMNYFTGVPYERPTFSTIGGSKVSDYLDMIRYVSSNEDIEWVQIKNELNENIFKLPLERLPETLSSKMTFNWRLKRKGYITFKYWVDGGNGSYLLFYINNQLVGGPWRDTDGWQVAKFNMSQGQTYKFDFLVHKEVSNNIGTNAVYIKDIEVVEVTDYTDKPMPADYVYSGENAEDDYGKWLIYSNKGVLGTYYRGFPDGIEDTVREIELEFYSECNGVFGFGYRLGTENPDRVNVEGLVFKELHNLNEDLVVWDGEKNAVGIPTISVKPLYGEWSNDVPDNFSFVSESVLWTKDSTDIIYKIKVDGDWDKGAKTLEGFGCIGLFCPPRYVVEERYELSSKVGSWNTTGAWDEDSQGASMEGYQDEPYGEAEYMIGDESTVFVSISIEENMLQNERLNIYLDDTLYFSSLSGFKDLLLNVPIFDERKIRFEVEKAPQADKELVFAGYFSFDGNYSPLDIEKAGDVLGVEDEFSDGRGREFRIEIPTGGLESPQSWYTNEGFTVNLSLLPGDNVKIKIPNTKIPYVDYDLLEELADELLKDREPREPVEHFYEDFNPFVNIHKFSFDNNWEVVDIFDFLGVGNHGDSVLLCRGDGGSNYVDVDLRGLNLSDGKLILNFQYGALFNKGDNLEIFALVDGKYRKLGIVNTSALTAEGITVKGIRLPDGVEKIRFVYNS